MIEIPECKEPESKHLKDEVVRSCLKGLHTPINPHAQRLLAAQAREANKLPKAKAKSKSNQKKDKGKKAQDEKDPEKKSKRNSKDAEKVEESGVPRTEYSAAKKDFMSQEWFLVLFLDRVKSCVPSGQSMFLFLSPKNFSDGLWSQVAGVYDQEEGELAPSLQQISHQQFNFEIRVDPNVKHGNCVQHAYASQI